MAFGKKKDQEEIINIPIENLDVDTDEIKVINEFYDNKGKKIKSYTLPVIEMVVILLLVIGCVYTFINYRFVEGDVIGKAFGLGPISVVSKDYNAVDYISDGKIIYYEGEKSFLPIDLKSNYKVNTITKVQDNKVFVPGQSIKDIPVSKAEIDYVIEP